jgi:FMN phosphatase YigB (HAD superfamily)
MLVGGPVGRPEQSCVFLIDVDNTLFDNDRFKEDLDSRIRTAVPAQADRFWRIYEEVRRDTGVVDYSETVRRLGSEVRDADFGRLLERVLNEMPFASYVYPEVPAVLARLWSLGTVAILSDGDAVYQPLKIERSGLAALARGNVLVYPHKERHLDEVTARFAASHYTQIDDKAPLLAVTKRRLGDRATTVHVRQGHYAAETSDGFVPDVIVERIGELVRVPARSLCP